MQRTSNTAELLCHLHDEIDRLHTPVFEIYLPDCNRDLGKPQVRGNDDR